VTVNNFPNVLPDICFPSNDIAHDYTESRAK